MIPFKTSIQLDRDSTRALYLQLANQLIQLIKKRMLLPGTKLPGSRILAAELNVHRKTVVACYEELLLQGWTESIPKKGTFVLKDLPELQRVELTGSKGHEGNSGAGFHYYPQVVHNTTPYEKLPDLMYLDDGISDSRITPIEEIARTYRRICAKSNVFDHLSYGSVFGNEKLRSVLVDYLNSTRGLQITKDNVLITRGSQMGIWLSATMLLKRKDVVVVGATNYGAADTTFLQCDATIKRVSVDEDGLVTDEIRALCEGQKIKAVYVTSHHHHPTTVTLSAERRIHLLNLSKEYGFAIIEDDYDYDFNYDHAPILPLASHDQNNNVIYIGSVCKSVAPVFRVGYLIGPANFVEEAASLRGYVDRQGDALLELTFAAFIKSGDLDRHIRKAMKIYQSRRDLICELMRNELSDFFEFEVPRGGMAVWTKLKGEYSWDQVSEAAEKEGLIIGNWRRYDLANAKHNYIRIGFASHNSQELKKLVNKFKCALVSISSN